MVKCFEDNKKLNGNTLRWIQSKVGQTVSRKQYACAEQLYPGSPE